MVSFLFCVSSLFSSCKDPKRTSLERQVLDNPSGISFVDTFDVKVETVRIDTPSTKNKSHFIVGNYKDNVMGEVNATAYAQLQFSGFDSLKFTVIDSVLLTIQHDFVLGDTAGTILSFNLHELTEVIDSATDYKSTSSLSYDSNPMESISFRFNRNQYASKKSSALKTFFENYAATQSDRSEQKFKEVFKGLAFVPTSTDAFAIGVRTSTASGFNIFIYADGSATPIALNISGSESQRFNSLTYNASGLPLASLSVSSPLSTEVTQNTAFMNDLFGIRARISFPGLPSFLRAVKEDYNLMEAYLLFNSSDGFSQDVYRPYLFLSMMECAADGSPLKETDGTYKFVQRETQNTSTDNYSAGNLYGSDNDNYIAYDNTSKRFKYPFSLYAKEIQKGGKENNPFIISLHSYSYLSTQAPSNYSFFDQSKRGVKLVVYYGKRAL